MNGTDVLVYTLISAVAGLGLTIAARLVDRFLPDVDHAHPLPALPDLNRDGRPG